MKTSLSKKIYGYRFLIILFLSLIAYAYIDLQSSSLTGNNDANRIGAHLMLAIVITLCGLYVSVKREIAFDFSAICFLLLFVWILLVDLILEVSLWTMIVHCGFAVLWFLDYSLMDLQAKKHTFKREIWLAVLICVFIFYYIYMFVNSAYMYRLKGRLIASNIVYNIIVLFPWLFYFLRKFKYKVALLCFVWIASLFSLKRGAIVAMAFITLYVVIAYGRHYRKDAKYYIKCLCAVLLLIAVILLINRIMDGYLLERFSSEQMEDGSGRGDLYPYIIKLILLRDDIELFIGSGSGSSVHTWGTGAHNEWLEFLFSFGVVGLLLYFLMMVSLFTVSLKSFRNDFYLGLASMIALLYVLIVGMVGGIFFMQSSFFIFGFFGFCTGRRSFLQNEKRRNYYFSRVH